EPGGHECACGARGCLEAEASGSAIARITGASAADAPLEVRERAGTLVGRAVASVANLLDLPLSVVSGSVALGYGEPFFAAAHGERVAGHHRLREARVHALEARDVRAAQLVQQRAAGEAIRAEAVQDGTVEARELRDRRVGVQRVAVAVEAVQERLVGARRVR